MYVLTLGIPSITLFFNADFFLIREVVVAKELYDYYNS